MDSQAIRDLFVDHGLRWTKQREDVYAALCRSTAHPTADELFTAVNAAGSAGGGAAEGGPISLATVYNSLEAFSRSGLCRRLSSPAATIGGDGAFRYDAEMTDHSHVVMRDGRVRDVPADLNLRILSHIPREVVAEVEARLGVTIDRMSVEFIETPRGARQGGPGSG